MIIATAGHVDHGKTTLIRALTGVDTDRLEEEKRRGLSINLGYAYLPTASGLPLGFIDVPGHRRFINTMIAGISGIDMGLLVVAADDGPMPQTLEHLDVLEQLSVPELLVVVSKMGRVPPERVDEVREELKVLLSRHNWPSPEMFPVDSTQGLGISELKGELLQRAQRVGRRKGDGLFRMSLDRAFNIKGSGLVVTGTIASGSVQTGDSLHLLDGRGGRVRGLRVHDGEAQTAIAGQRCAINLAGNLAPAELPRGTWLLGEDAVSPGEKIDVVFSLLLSAPFPLKHLAPVKLHIGAGRIAGRLALLDKEQRSSRLHPGDTCLARLLLDEPVAACRGDRFLLRDHAETVTLGGGLVLDPFAPGDRKMDNDRLAVLKALQLEDTRDSLAALVATGLVLDREKVRLTFNLPEAEFQQRLSPDAKSFSALDQKWLVHESQWTRGQERLQQTVARWQRENQSEAGMPVGALKDLLSQDIGSSLLMALLTTAIESQRLVLKNGLVSEPGFSVVASPAAQGGWNTLRDLFQTAGRQIPLVTELAQNTGMDKARLDELLIELERSGYLRRISSKRFAQPEVLQVFANDVLALDSAGEPVTVVAARDRFGVGRNLAIEVLEYFDRIHFTRRLGDVRIIHDADVPAKGFTR